MRTGYLIDLGLLGYKNALGIQREIHERRASNGTKDTLLFVEHPQVITLGKAGDRRNLLVSLPELRKRGIEFHKVERGGDITFHGPGQLVGYPIFSIRDGLPGVRPFVVGLESALISALRRLGIEAQEKHPMIGVWVGEDKIASIGVAVKAGVTFHGFALNVSVGLTPFQLINPCGAPSQRVTSVQKVLGNTVPMERAKREVKLAVEEVFGIRLVEVRIEA